MLRYLTCLFVWKRYPSIWINGSDKYRWSPVSLHHLYRNRQDFIYILYIWFRWPLIYMTYKKLLIMKKILTITKVLLSSIIDLIVRSFITYIGMENLLLYEDVWYSEWGGWRSRYMNMYIQICIHTHIYIYIYIHTDWGNTASCQLSTHTHTHIYIYTWPHYHL